MSTSFWWNDEDFNNVILVEDPPPNPLTYTVYLDSGDSGDSQDDKPQVSVKFSQPYNADVSRYFSPLDVARA